MKYLKYIILVIALTAFAAAHAAPTTPMVKARLDSASILMGKTTTLRLEVTQEKGKPGGFPLLSGDNKLGYIAVCGDSVELRTDYKRDTLEVGTDKIQINYAIPVQAFDSGFYQLPQFIYVCGTDSARSNIVSLKVVPVAVTADAKISDYAPVADPPGGNIFDYLPDWLVNFWWLIVIVLLIIAVGVYLWRRYKTDGYIIPRKPEPLPYDVAIRDLKTLKGLNLWEQGMEKEYFTKLTDILRIYLDKRFGINAIEMTTPEILTKLSENPAIKDKRDYIHRILDTADYVKFAKVRPLPEDNIAAYDTALKFVEKTKPSEEEIAAYKAALETANNAGHHHPKAKKKTSAPIKISKKPSKIRKKGGKR